MEPVETAQVAPVFPRWFRRKVAEAMEASGVTMAELSRRTGIDNSFLKRMLDRKGNTKLGEDYIDAIAQALDIRISELPREPLQVTVTHSKKLADPSHAQGRESDYLAGPIVERGARDRARELLARVGLEDRARSFPDRLSGGEQQRVAIARALVCDPRLVLADEPTGNLDDATGAAVLDLLDAVTRRAGKTLLLVTHSAEVAARADRVLTIEDGRLTPSPAP